MLEVSREQIAETMLTNLVQAGAIEPEEVEEGRKLADTLSDDDLVRLLVESHQLRELAAELQPERLRPLLIITRINLN